MKTVTVASFMLSGAQATTKFISLKETQCGPDGLIRSLKACKDAAAALGKNYRTTAGSDWDEGCIENGAGVYFSDPDQLNGPRNLKPDGGYLCKGAPNKNAYVVKKGKEGICAKELQIESAAECVFAAQQKDGVSSVAEAGITWQAGCLVHGNGAYWNDPKKENQNVRNDEVDTGVLCRVVPNVDCVGEWSACTEKCQRKFYEEVAQSGNGKACNTLQSPDCQPGDGSCPLNIDCKGEWSKCTEECEHSSARSFIEEFSQSGNGKACPSQTQADCVRGMGDCVSYFPEEMHFRAALVSNDDEVSSCADPNYEAEGFTPEECETSFNKEFPTLGRHVQVKTEGFHKTEFPNGCFETIINGESNLWFNNDPNPKEEDEVKKLAVKLELKKMCRHISLPRDLCPNDPLKTSPEKCGCGTPDVDTDSDGTLDCFDECPNDPFKTSPEKCGCGVEDTDLDGDGIPDCFDQCPDDPLKTSPEKCGCGVEDTDSDGDGIPDCQEHLYPTSEPEDPLGDAGFDDDKTKQFHISMFTEDCNPKMCAHWNCLLWCKCFEDPNVQAMFESVQYGDILSSRVCPDDGTDTCPC